ncbi:MAG: sigma-54 dependent transcriptional regulator [Planctomycetota bacterium]
MAILGVETPDDDARRRGSRDRDGAASDNSAGALAPGIPPHATLGSATRTTTNDDPIPGVIGNGAAMRGVYQTTRRVAPSRASVLILGETGVGKELIAAALHRLSTRAAGPLVRVNCGALSESLLESELFGHVRGAFTGAVATREGRFEAANGGTIFLDEVNSTSLTMQVKLLRVLQERTFERVGDTKTLTTDVRVIAASNRDLTAAIAAEEFREDLYWRLNVVPIVIPPLRERREDIPALVSHFLEYYNEANDRYVTHVEPAAMTALQSYHWPGNVRELQNYVERAVVMSETDELTLGVLPAVVSGADPVVLPDGAAATMPADFDGLARQVVSEGIGTAAEDETLHSRVVDRVEKELIQQVLKSCGGVQTKAATRLGMNRNTLHKKIKDYGIFDEE